MKGGCELRIVVIEKMQKSRGGSSRWGGGGVRVEGWIEVIVKMQNKVMGGLWGTGVRVEVNQELKLL